MIKQLITDLAHGSISLSTSLTRSKILAVKVGNESFSKWLKGELEGYQYDDKSLPSYRMITCSYKLVAEFPWGRRTFPVVLNDNEDEEFKKLLKKHKVTESIALIERNMERLTTPKGIIPLIEGQTRILAKMYEDDVHGKGGLITESFIEVAKVEYENIIELTKQKLLDTLLELDQQFPNFENEFIMSKDNSEKVQNIITNNIYGNNNPLNVAAGVEVSQSDISTSYSLDFETLKQLGVQEHDIDELKQIIQEKDKPSMKSKALKWLGGVTASIAARGLYENIPQITELIGKVL